MPATTLFDAMRDGGVERLRFKREKGATRVLAARKDGPWAGADELLPRSPADLTGIRARFELGGHERLDLVFRDEVGLRFLCAVHSTLNGPGAGGLRRHELSVPELDVVQDVLNLSRAMTYKNAAAGLQRGGSKICVHNPGIPGYMRDEWLACITEEVDISGTVTGPDSGFEGRLYADLADASSNVSGVRGGGTSRSAADGVLAALTATRAALGQPLGEMRVAIQGLGHLGTFVAEDLVNEGAALVVTDKNHRRIDALLGALTPEARRRIDVVAPYQILDVPADILCPCAVGGVITPASVGGLQVRAICGGANNQLEARCLEEELELARALMGRGVLFVPDWLASAGGAIHGIMELADGEAFDLRRVHARVARTCGWMVDDVLSEARRTGNCPLDIAVRRHLADVVAAASLDRS